MKTVNWKILSVAVICIPLAFMPVLHDQYTVIKWAIVYFSAALCAFGLSGQKDGTPSAPKGLPNGAIFAGCLFLLFDFISLWQNDFSFLTTRLMDWLAFLAIALTAFKAQQNNPQFLQAIFMQLRWPLSAVLGYGILQAIGVEPFDFLWHNSFPASFFGFQNMTAEFVGIALLGMLFHCFSRPAVPRHLLFLCGFSAAYLFLLASRAALLAFFLSLLFILPLKPWRHQKSKLLTLVLSATLLLISVWGVRTLPHFISNQQIKNSSEKKEDLPKPQDLPFAKESINALLETKVTNTQIRWIRWKNTWEMIVENPWGVGPGRYEFGYLPFSRRRGIDPEATESLVPRSPHNSWLESTAESGWLFGLFIFLTVTSAAVALLCQKEEPTHQTRKWLLLSLIVFLAVDASVAFPLENAFPFMIVALLLGSVTEHLKMSHHTRPKASPSLFKGVKILWALVGLFLMFASTAWLYSQYQGAHFPHSPFAQSNACRFFPENLRPCTQFAALLLRAGQLEPARKILEDNLNRQPWHTPSLGLMADIKVMQDKPHEACPWLIKLEKALGNNHSRTQMRQTLCP